METCPSGWRSPDLSGESVYTGNCIIPIYRDESLSLRIMKENFFVYILQSLKDFSFYIGQTDNLDFRVSNHNEGLSKYTASKRPWKLVYFETLSCRSEALKREKQIKNMKSRVFIENLIRNWRPDQLIKP